LSRSRGIGLAGTSREPGPTDDAGHFVGLEAGATDQGSIDRRFRQEFADV